MTSFNGLGLHLGNLSQLSNAETRSISPENFRGEKGKGGMATEGTGAEDYFCGSYNFENQETKQYQVFTNLYSGLHQVLKPDGVYQSQTRFGMYRWHIVDPIRFKKDLGVTISASKGGESCGYQPQCRHSPRNYPTRINHPFEG